MPGFFRNYCLAVVLGEVVCTLGTAACAQQAAAPAQPGQSASALLTATSSHRLTHADTFAAFMQEIGQDDLAARKEAITGEKQSRVDWKTVNRVSVGLTDEEWAIAWSILLDGSQKVDNWGDQMQDALGWKDGRYQVAPSGHATERLANLEVLSDGGAPIVNDTVDMLRQNLGDRAFSRLDAFVYQREGGQRIVEPAPIQRGPIETAKAATQPVVQTTK
jgi:hypothetical protein